MYFVFVIILPIVSVLCLTHALPAGPLASSVESASFDSEPGTLLGKPYTVHNRDYPAVDATRNPEALAEPIRAREGRGGSRTGPPTRAARFQLSHYRRTHPITTEDDTGRGTNLLSNQDLSPVAASSSLSPPQVTTAIAPPSATVQTMIVRPSPFTYTNTPEKGRNRQKGKAWRKSKPGAHDSHPETG